MKKQTNKKGTIIIKEKEKPTVIIKEPKVFKGNPNRRMRFMS